MAALASSMEGCHGARMTGAGFGGSVVALLEEDRVGPAVDEVSASLPGGDRDRADEPRVRRGGGHRAYGRRASAYLTAPLNSPDT